MEFIPHTRAALDEYLSLTDPDLEAGLLAMGDVVTRIVPECVGLSLWLFAEDLTFTLVADDARTDLDALHYISRGPYAAAVRDDALRDAKLQDPLDEDGWLLFAQESAAAGIASTLSLPLVHDGEVVGGIYIYASTANAFTGHHEELAAALGSSATGTVINSDLSFESRVRAVQAPGRLRDQRLVDVAVGTLAAREGMDVAAAYDQLRRAAESAGVTEAQAAQVFLQVHRTDDGPS